MDAKCLDDRMVYGLFYWFLEGLHDIMPYAYAF
jgi:hypothetical protein